MSLLESQTDLHVILHRPTFVDMSFLEPPNSLIFRRPPHDHSGTPRLKIDAMNMFFVLCLFRFVVVVVVVYSQIKINVMFSIVLNYF